MEQDLSRPTCWHLPAPDTEGCKASHRGKDLRLVQITGRSHRRDKDLRPVQVTGRSHRRQRRVGHRLPLPTATCRQRRLRAGDRPRWVTEICLRRRQPVDRRHPWRTAHSPQTRRRQAGRLPFLGLECFRLIRWPADLLWSLRGRAKTEMSPGSLEPHGAVNA